MTLLSISNSIASLSPLTLLIRAGTNVCICKIIYSKIESDYCEDTAGMRIITTIAECESAAGVLRLGKTSANTFNWNSINSSPPGCFTYQSDGEVIELRFNTQTSLSQTSASTSSYAGICKAKTYVKITSSSCEFTSGTNAITDPAICWAAAQNLGYFVPDDTTSNIKNSQSYPPGCSIYQDSVVFNTRTSSSYQCRPDEDCICEPKEVVKITTSTCAATSGMQEITNPAICLVAAKNLGISEYFAEELLAPEESSALYPPGCFRYIDLTESGGAFFNTGTTFSNQCSTARACICELTSRRRMNDDDDAKLGPLKMIEQHQEQATTNEICEAWLTEKQIAAGNMSYALYDAAVVGPTTGNIRNLYSLSPCVPSVPISMWINIIGGLVVVIVLVWLRDVSFHDKHTDHVTPGVLSIIHSWRLIKSSFPLFFFFSSSLLLFILFARSFVSCARCLIQRRWKLQARMPWYMLSGLNHGHAFSITMRKRAWQFSCFTNLVEAIVFMIAAVTN